MSEEIIDGEVSVAPEVKPGTWLAEKDWDVCPIQGPVDLVWIGGTPIGGKPSRCLVGQYFSDTKELALQKDWWLDLRAAKNLVLIIEGLDRGESFGDLLPDPFTPPAVDLDDIWDDEELEGIVACSKDGETCESCQ